ncbi:MAG: oligosaccharide flippase family protein [Acidimicrobiaceae bacterium]|nr:oligosaccharide flippase family protein [Acidimicrobiaceae bacterium]
MRDDRASGRRSTRVGRLTRMLRTSLAGDTAWSLGAEAVRMVGGLFVFFVLARALGTDGFGEFTAIAAVVSFVVPLAQVGASLLLVQRIRRDDYPAGDASPPRSRWWWAAGWWHRCSPSVVWRWCLGSR